MTQNHKYNLANKISLIILLGIFIWLLYYGFYQFFPFKIIQFEKSDINGIGQYKVLSKTVPQGGLLHYRVLLEKFSDKTATLSCNFQDGLLYRVAEFHSNLSIGEHDYVQVIDIPVGLPAGKYEYACIVTYELRTGRLVQYRFVTDTFEVIEK
jgi:hypothetical protein